MDATGSTSNSEFVVNDIGVVIMSVDFIVIVLFAFVFVLRQCFLFFLWNSGSFE